MERYAFFRQLGKAVYGIDAAYDVFSKSAQIKPNMLWLLSALNDGEGHTQKQICWDWGFRHGGFARRERFGGDRSGIHEHMAAGRHYIRRFGRLFRAGGA